MGFASELEEFVGEGDLEALAFDILVLLLLNLN